MPNTFMPTPPPNFSHTNVAQFGSIPQPFYGQSVPQQPFQNYPNNPNNLNNLNNPGNQWNNKKQ